MILPIYAGLERIPGSLLEASADLGGRGWMTFRRVILPLPIPAVVAGLDLHVLADARRLHRARRSCRRTQFIGNVIYINVAPGPAARGGLLARSRSAIMLVYLLVARRLGAFEAF